MENRQHWETVYATRSPDRVGWFKPRLETSLAWIRALQLDARVPIIDIGGGASTLVDDLLDAGHRDITVLDIAENALQQSQSRLGTRADRVHWIAADVRTALLPANRFGLWHDRAVFHFLTDAEDQRRYREQAASALRAGGHLMLGTFAPEAPPTCSGLPVQRYDSDSLARALGDGFALLRHRKEMHTTPGGVEQMYLYSLFRLQ